MTTKRSKGAAGRRLRVESLEDRAVPATGTDVEVVPPVDDPNKPVIVGELPPTEEGPIVTMVDGEIDPDVIFQTTSDDQPPLDDTPPEVDLATTAAIDKIKPSIGDIVTVTVTVKNEGPDPATGVDVSSVLPAGLNFVSATSGDGSGAYDAATGDWAVGAIAPGGSAVLKIKAKVIDSAEQSVAASITSADQTDPDVENNDASLTVTPVLASIRLGKVASVANPAVNSTVIFTVVVRNTGPGTARDIAVTDTLGSGLTFLKALPPTRGVFNGNTKTWKIAALPAGTSATLQIVARVTALGRIESPATLTGTGIDDTTSKFDAMVAVTGVKPSTPATLTHYTAPGFKPGPAPAAPVRPTTPPMLPPILPPSLIAQLLLGRGVILPALRM